MLGPQIYLPFIRYVGQNVQIMDDVIIPNRFNLDKTVDAYGRSMY